MSNLPQQNPMLAALDAAGAQQQREAEQGNLRREYVALLRANDPARVGRLLEVAKALGMSAESVKDDFAIVNPAPAAPPPPLPEPTDWKALNSEKKIEYALGREKANAQAGAASGSPPAPAPLPADWQTRSSVDKIALALRGEKSLREQG